MLEEVILLLLELFGIINPILINNHNLDTSFLFCFVVSGIWNSYSSSNLTMYTELEDMIHLPGPLTEDSVLKTLQARFYKGQYYVSRVSYKTIPVYTFSNGSSV